MESKTEVKHIPTALPGFEDDDAREKLLLETAAAAADTESDDDEPERLVEKQKPMKRRLRILRTVVGFGIFLGLLAFAVSWFFHIGWFAESKPQPVSRNASKDTPASPATEDEKLKMALSLVAANGSKPAMANQIDPEGTSSTSETSVNGSTAPVGDLRVDGQLPIKASPEPGESRYDLAPSSDKTPTQKQSETETSIQASEKKKASALAISRTDLAVDAPGRSLFFGVTRKPLALAPPERISENTISAVSVNEALHKGIPFGTLLPVRLVGSIYTLKNSSGLVRMELTRPVEGKGYSYPAGTTVIGNARGGGESARAFVTVIGLIDPVSGELVKFGGELLGKDGASGIEGKRRRLTSQWARFFTGLKDTASSVLGSVGALRSGSTVILSEPIRRGSESISEDLSNALLGNSKDKTFIEVSAGTNGYVLVTDLPDASSATTGKLKAEAAEK